jgi:hypothetical protein
MAAVSFATLSDEKSAKKMIDRNGKASCEIGMSPVALELGILLTRLVA